MFMDKNFSLNCAMCGFSGTYNSTKEAFLDGWDFLEGGLNTCPKCPSSELMILIAKYGDLSKEVSNFCKKKLTSSKI